MLWQCFSSQKKNWVDDNHDHTRIKQKNILTTVYIKYLRNNILVITYRLIFVHSHWINRSNVVNQMDFILIEQGCDISKLTTTQVRNDSYNEPNSFKWHDK